MRKSRTLNLVLCGMFTALITAGAFIRIDLVIPMTLQSTVVILAGMTLGAKNGALCTTVYMLLGLAGLPIFAQGGGFMYVLKPSFGYILGFILGAFVTGYMAKRRKNPTVGYLYCAGLAGMACIYAVGILYCIAVMSLYVKGGSEINTAYLLTALVALPADLILLIPASVMAKRIIKITNRQLQS